MYNDDNSYLVTRILSDQDCSEGVSGEDASRHVHSYRVGSAGSDDCSLGRSDLLHHEAYQVLVGVQPDSGLLDSGRS